MAYQLLASEKLRQAFDLGLEPTRDPRALRHDALRPGRADGPAAGRGGRAVRHGLLGRVRPGRHRLGHALGPLPPDEGRAAARASTGRSPACSSTSTAAGCSTRRWSSCLSEHGRTPKLAVERQGRRPRPLVAVLLGGDGRRRHRPGPGRRPVRQDRQRPGRAPGLAQGHPGHDLPPAGHRPDHASHRPPGPPDARLSPRPRSSPRRWPEDVMWAKAES